MLFEQVRLTRPTVIVLKKNSRVLRKWKDILVNTDICHGLPLVIFDDEADAASLNTKVNSNKVSPINRNLLLIKRLQHHQFTLRLLPHHRRYYSNRLFLVGDHLL